MILHLRKMREFGFVLELSESPFFQMIIAATAETSEEENPHEDVEKDQISIRSCQHRHHISCKTRGKLTSTPAPAPAPAGAKKIECNSNNNNNQSRRRKNKAQLTNSASSSN